MLCTLIEACARGNIRVYARRGTRGITTTPPCAGPGRRAAACAGRVRQEVQGPVEVRRAGAVRAARPAARLRRPETAKSHDIRELRGTTRCARRRARRLDVSAFGTTTSTPRERREGPRGAFPERHDRGVRARADLTAFVERIDASRDERRSAAAYRCATATSELFAAFADEPPQPNGSSTRTGRTRQHPSVPRRAGAAAGAHAAHAPEGALGRAGGGGGGVDGGARGCETRGGARETRRISLPPAAAKRTATVLKAPPVAYGASSSLRLAYDATPRSSKSTPRISTPPGEGAAPAAPQAQRLENRCSPC